MVDHVEVIRKQMDETRTSLADKIEALETQVTDTVKEATTDVTDTVQSVKDAVTDVTDSVKETVTDVTQTVAGTVEEVAHNVSSFFDVTGHVRRHPWAGFGGSVLAGLLVGQLLPRGRSRDRDEADFRDVSASQRYTSAAVPFTAEPTPAPAAAPAPAQPEKKGWFAEELGRFKDLAVGTVLGLVRDLAAQSLPEAIGKKVAAEMNRITDHLGAEKIEEPILTESASASSFDYNNGRRPTSPAGM